MNSRHIIRTAFLAAVAGLILAACSGQGQKLGSDIPAGAQTVKLAEVMASPADFHNKKIVMKGVISGQCPSLCEFFYKEGVHKATIFPHGYKFPKLKTGRPVTVYAQVTHGSENVVFSALGVRVD